MELLPCWNARIQEVKSEPIVKRVNYGLKKLPRYYSEKTNFINSVDGAQAMLEFALQRPLSHIGFDTEFRFDRPGVVIDKNHTAYDNQSIHPLLLSLAMAEQTGDDGGVLYNFVIDLRNPELLPVLNELFRLPVTFCGHFAKVELFCLWRLGLIEPNILWDTFIFEKALHLGRFHHKYKLQKVTDEFEKIRAKEETNENKGFSFSLVATCQRHGVAYRMETEKKRLQQSFLIHPDDTPFSQEQIEYSAEDAIAACQLYPLQVQKAVQNGLLHHCMTVEMPWVITNARIEWVGVRVYQTKCNEVISKIGEHKERLEKHLAVEYGIKNTRSHKQLEQYFQNCGLLHNFQQGGTVSFDKEILKLNARLHPAIALLRDARRASDILSDKILSPEFIGLDGRMRSEHQQLGTDTGRQTNRWPNLMGLDKVLRPLIIPNPGYGIGEVDWSQVEVGVAAAMYGDDKLVQMFNSGDVYSAMAQHFFQEEIPPEDLVISGKEFKTKYKELRNQMKTCTLGIIYGITPTGLAQNLGTTKTKAAELQKRFMTMFPQLRDALNQTACFGGYQRLCFSHKRFETAPG